MAAKALILMRHGKAEPAAAAGDHGRPLSGRGRAEAAEAGRRLLALARPDLALLSDSLRTRQTLERAMEASPGVEARASRALYGATADAVLAAVRAAPDGAETLLVVGHNPGMGDLARRLATRGPADALARLGAGFPTSCFAVIGFECARWAEVAPGGELLFVLPAEARAGA